MKTRVIQDDPDEGMPADVDASPPEEPPLPSDAPTTSDQQDSSAPDRATAERQRARHTTHPGQE